MDYEGQDLSQAEATSPHRRKFLLDVIDIGWAGKIDEGDTAGEREKFESEYRRWLLSVAKDVYRRLAGLPSERRQATIEGYRKLKDPTNVFRPLSNSERIERLAGGRAENFILLETSAVTFFPSIHSLGTGAMDFSVAMNRRFYWKGLWFPIIALHSDYIRRSPDRILQFALEHEFEMARIYEEVSLDLRAISRGEKHEIASSAQRSSADRLKISPDELIQDEKLMLELSVSQPLMPKPYAETALLLHLKNNFSLMERYGIISRNDEEEELGKELLKEFESWSEFSIRTYATFVSEVAGGVRDIDSGYC